MSDVERLSDESDIATANELATIEASLSKVREAAASRILWTVAEAADGCLECGEEVPYVVLPTESGYARWCCAEHRDDWCRREARR